MGKIARRRKKLAPASRPPTTVHDIPDHLLKLVIRRLDTHVSFLRAAAVCKRWRRIAASRGVLDWKDDFLDRHPGPHVLGHYHVFDSPSRQPPAPGHRFRFVPAEPNSVNAGHFSLDGFLPRGRRPWELVDGCGGLLLLANRKHGFFPDLVVCDPISRRYVRIHPITEMKYQRCLGVSLHRNTSVCNLSNFMVICVLFERSVGMADDMGTATSCIFDQSPPCRKHKNGWQMQRVDTWDLYGVRDAESVHPVGRSAGSMFWHVKDDDTVLAAWDNGKLIPYHLPEHLHGSHQLLTFRFVDNGVKEDGHPRMVRLVSLIGDELKVFAMGFNDRNEWHLERTLRLSQVTAGIPGHKEGFFGSTAKIVAAWEGYLMLTPAEETWMFSLDLKTMRVERVDNRNSFVTAIYPYEIKTSPVVEACVIQCEREGSRPTWRGHGKCSHICICG